MIEGTTTVNERKLSLATKIGYGAGTFGESIAMNTYYIYFIFFLTNVVGLSASIAGTISLVTLFWNACTDVVAGYRSDGSRNPKGRRRPFIAKAAIPLAIAATLMYTDISAISDTGKIVYYLIVNVLFWTCLSFVDIPYVSLGSEISGDYYERTGIRALATMFNSVGTILASSGTLAIVAFFSSKDGLSDNRGWAITGGIYALLILLAFYTSYFSTKGREKPNVLDEKADSVREKRRFFRDFRDIAMLRPFKYLVGYTIVVYGTLLIFTCTYVYYFIYKMGYSEAKIAIVMLAYSVMVIVLSPIVGKLTERIGKKPLICSSATLYGIGFITFKSVGLTDTTIYVAFFLLALVFSTFNVIVFSMVYDICGVDEFVYGSGRDGIIVSVFFFTMKIVTGIAMGVGGWILTISGYDAAASVQSAGALSGIATGMFLIPGIGGILGAVILLGYPITEKKYNAMKAATVRKYSGQTYTLKGFEDLI